MSLAYINSQIRVKSHVLLSMVVDLGYWTLDIVSRFMYE